MKLSDLRKIILEVVGQVMTETENTKASTGLLPGLGVQTLEKFVDDEAPEDVGPSVDEVADATAGANIHTQKPEEMQQFLNLVAKVRKTRDEITALKKAKLAKPDDVGIKNRFRELSKEIQGYKEEVAKFKKPYLHPSNVDIKDEAGNLTDPEKLKRKIKIRPEKILKMNAKMSKSAGPNTRFFNIGLPAYKGLAVNETTGEFVVIDTCPGAGACLAFCYAKKGGYIQYKAASMTQTQLLNFLVNDPQGYKTKLSNEIRHERDRAKGSGLKLVIRWHDSGDFFSKGYLDIAYDLAKEFPEIEFYAYTKMAYIALGDRPDNFQVNFSFGAAFSQEMQIDKDKIKHSVVVPEPMFKKYMVVDDKGEYVRDEKKRLQFKSDDDMNKLKTSMSYKYSIPKDSILTYDELLDIPATRQKNKYNVIVRPGDGDISASRGDVKGTYLLIH